jgi:hypothetical protein
MTAERIREQQLVWVRSNGKQENELADGSASTFALMEIALQLAELNQNIKTLVNVQLTSQNIPHNAFDM